jgi:hypothetical protein
MPLLIFINYVWQKMQMSIGESRQRFSGWLGNSQKKDTQSCTMEVPCQCGQEALFFDGMARGSDDLIRYFYVCKDCNKFIEKGGDE